MFRLLSSVIFFLSLSQSFAAEVPCGSVLPETPFAKELRIEATVFSIANCESHTQAFEAVEEWLSDRSESHDYEPEWFSYAKSNGDEAVVMMEEDHSMGDGEGPWNSDKVDAVIGLYTSPSMHKDLWLGEYADSYMSGTGITGLIILQTKQVDKLIVIEKFLYAE